MDSSPIPLWALLARQPKLQTCVIDKTGKITHQSMGYTPADFKRLVEAVRKATTE